LNEFLTVHFTQAMRSSGDPAHTAALAFFRDPSRSLYPVKDSNVLKILQRLSPMNEGERKRWMNATIVCCDNMTRVRLNQYKAQQYAAATGQVVICWVQQLTEKTFEHVSAAAQVHNTTVDDIVRKYDELTFFFVPGAPAILTRNINNDEKLTNGTRCTLHSLTLLPEDEQLLRQQISTSVPGSIVHLKSPPVTVNVHLPDTWYPGTHPLSIVADKNVIPLRQSTQQTSVRLSSESKHGRLDSNHVSTTLNFKSHDVDLAFAVTYHKVQGQTLSEVILDVSSNSHPPIQLSSFYVGISRVRSSESIRLLYDSDNDLKNLEQLTFTPTLLNYWDRIKPTVTTTDPSAE
jgi:hypothetical protein